MASFRLDRFLTLYLFRFLISKKNKSSDKKIPILMYHSISDDREESHPYYHVNTSPAVFDAHMQYLHDNHYSVINLSDLEKCFNANDQSKYIVITFDDGFRDFHTRAYPILKKYGFGATVFLPTEFIQDNRSSFKGKECMTWAEVRQLSKDCIIFGSHTATHPQLSELGDAVVEHEILFSKKVIEEKMGAVVNVFAYPYKFPDENIRFKTMLQSILQKHGYLYGVSTRIGISSQKDNIYFMKRIPVNNDDDISFFKAKLDGGYDWLYPIQSITKFIRSKINHNE